MPLLGQLVFELLPMGPLFSLKPVHVGCMVDRMALGHIFLCVFQFLPVSVIPPKLHNRWCIIHS